jgi:hypothetical protein
MWFSIWDMVYLEVFDFSHYYFDLLILSLCGFALYVACALSVGSSKNSNQALKKPLSVGAVSAASEKLVSGMVSQVDCLHEVVVEPGRV